MKQPSARRPKTPEAGENPTARKALDAAEEVFAEKGFAGARVDEIAARAGMAKSHVYYHFEGKQEMLDRLIALRLSEILAKKDALLAGVTELSPGAIAEFVPRAIHELLVPHERFLRVVLLESLGHVEGEPLLLRVLRPLLADAARRFEALGYEIDRERFVSDFFHFGVLPVVMHVVLAERWTKAARIPRARALDLVVERLVELQTLNVQRMTRRKRTPRGGTP